MGEVDNGHPTRCEDLPLTWEGVAKDVAWFLKESEMRIVGGHVVEEFRESRGAAQLVVGVELQNRCGFSGGRCCCII